MVQFGSVVNDADPCNLVNHSRYIPSCVSLALVFASGVRYPPNFGDMADTKELWFVWYCLVCCVSSLCLAVSIGSDSLVNR